MIIVLSLRFEFVMALLYLGDHDSNPSFAYPAFFLSFLAYALLFFHYECLVVIWY